MGYDWARALRHLLHGPWSLRTRFPPAAMSAIEAAVRACEARHAGEIRVVIEAALPFEAAVQGLSPRVRAVEVFAEQRVWDTEHNNGVLIYLLLADRDVEIVADRGVAQADWESCCRVMERELHAGRYAQGVVAGVEAVAAQLALGPATRADIGNELQDAPTLL